MTPQDRRARFAAQLLAGPPAATAEQAVGRVLAVQGQDPRGFRLAVRARTAGVSAADVDRGLAERRLVVAWLNRGTLHLVRAEDYPWLHALTAPPLAAANRRRLEQEGVTPALADHGVDVVVEALSTGPRSREELRAVLDAAGVPTRGQALVHVLFETSLRHRLIRGPVEGGDHLMVLADAWLPAAPGSDRDEALARLAERYLAGHGPATDRDLAVWAGLPLRDVRAGLAAIRDRTVEHDGLVVLDDADSAGPPPLPAPRLLGNFDPILHGWASREPLTGPHDRDIVLGGVFRSVVLVEGSAAGIWRIDGGRVRIRPFAPLPPPVERALLDDAAAVLAYLGLPHKDPVVESAG